MKNLLLIVSILILGGPVCGQSSMNTGKPNIQSMGVLEFAPDGVLLIGDSKAGTVFAVDLGDNTPSGNANPLIVRDIEEKVAGLLGTTKDDVLIHDLAVNSISQNAYLSVSRGRSNWVSNWQFPKELEDAKVLVRVLPDGTMNVVALDNVPYSAVQIPNPINEAKEHAWKKGAKLRADAISDIAVKNGKVYIAGLSNEEFSSSMWVMPYPFNNKVSATTLEIYHGAHGAYETESPIRAFLPYQLNGKPHLIAAYLCTPLVTFETSKLQDGQHIKGKTVAEFGAGNFPIDMVTYQFENQEYILMSNSQLPLLVFNPREVEAYDGEIKEKVEGYLEGVNYTPRAGSGIYHLANLNDAYVLATQRLANGQLVLNSLSKKWLKP